MEVEENVEKCRARLSIFWDAEAEGFRRIWAALSKTCVCGCGSDMKASAILFPELVHDLLIGDAVLLDDDGEKSFDLPSIMHAHATVDNKLQELTDLAYISELQSKGVLKVEENQPRLIHVMAGTNRGKVIQVNEWLPEFEEGLESGLFVDNVTWQYLTKKQTGMMALLSTFADKYFTIRAVLEKRAIRPHACPISSENE